MTEFTNLQATLEQYIQEVLDLYKSKIRSKVASGALINSISYSIQAGEDTLEVSINLAEHYKYIEWDTKPHFPPIEPILKWVKAKNILPRPDSNGKLPTEKSLAFLIARKISKTGTKGGHYLEDSIQAINNKYNSLLDAAVTKDLEALWDNLIKH